MSSEKLQLGRYQLQQKVGSGGMGEVYLAEDSLIHRQVAIKVVRNEPTGPYPDTESARIAAQLFEREMKIISQLDHPHILPLYDYGEAEVSGEKTIYMVMPYRPEGSLLAWLRQRQSSELLSPPDVATFIEHAASALQHAHEQQVIHQDIKPSNFLIRVRPEEPTHPDLLLTDFGISRTTTATSSTGQMIQGTPTYMAPEQWEGHAAYASDQYALAVMAYELLTGRPPFVGKPGEVMYQHLITAPPPPSSLNPALSASIDAVLLRALAKKPDERFSSVSAFSVAFQQAISGETLSASNEGAEGSANYIDPANSTHEARRGAMGFYDLNTSTTPETPTARPDSDRPPLTAPTVVIAPPAPTTADQNGAEHGELAPPIPVSLGGPGTPATPFTFPANGMPSRPTTFLSDPKIPGKGAIVRIVFIALLLIGASSLLLYYFVLIPQGKTGPVTSTQHGGSGVTQANNKTTGAVQSHATATTTPPMNAQRQAITPTQVTVHVIPQASPTATVNSEATAQANAEATARARANVQATATAVVAASSTPLYRLYSATTGDHFYTTSAKERDSAIANAGYKSESTAANVFSGQVGNSVPLYRLYSGQLGDHFYTTSAKERDNAASNLSYTYEGIACYVYSTQVGNSVPLYRLYNGQLGDHFYTTSAKERDTVASQGGYTYEGIAAYVLPG